MQLTYSWVYYLDIQIFTKFSADKNLVVYMASCAGLGVCSVYCEFGAVICDVLSYLLTVTTSLCHDNVVITHL